MLIWNAIRGHGLIKQRSGSTPFHFPTARIAHCTPGSTLLHPFHVGLVPHHKTLIRPTWSHGDRRWMPHASGSSIDPLWNLIAEMLTGPIAIGSTLRTVLVSVFVSMEPNGMLIQATILVIGIAQRVTSMDALSMMGIMVIECWIDGGSVVSSPWRILVLVMDANQLKAVSTIVQSRSPDQDLFLIAHMCSKWSELLNLLRI